MLRNGTFWWGISKFSSEKTACACHVFKVRIHHKQHIIPAKRSNSQGRDTSRPWSHFRQPASVHTAYSRGYKDVRANAGCLLQTGARAQTTPTNSEDYEYIHILFVAGYFTPCWHQNQNELSNQLEHIIKTTTKVALPLLFSHRHWNYRPYIKRLAMLNIIRWRNVVEKHRQLV